MLIVCGIALFIVGCELIVSLLVKKKSKPEEHRKNIWKRIKNVPLHHKIGYILLFLLYLIFPLLYVTVFLIALLIIILFYFQGWLNKIRSLSLSALYHLFSIVCFFGLYILLIPEAVIDYGYPEPTISLSKEASQAYKDIIDDSEFYHSEPVSYYENDDFGFIALRTYIKWDYTLGLDDINVRYCYRFFKKGNFNRKDYLLILRSNEKIIIEIKYGKNTSVDIIIENEDEANLYFEIRSTANQELIYRSSYFSMEKDFYTTTEEIFYGGQFIDTDKNIFFLLTLFVHLSFLIFLSLIYLSRKVIFKDLKINSHLNILKQE